MGNERHRELNKARDKVGYMSSTYIHFSKSSVAIMPIHQFAKMAFLPEGLCAPWSRFNEQTNCTQVQSYKPIYTQMPKMATLINIADLVSFSQDLT